MRNNLIIIFITLVLITLASILQSTFFNYIAIAGIKPDITLIILVYISFKTGSNNGQIVGFTSGLLQDILTSSTPLGFFACIRTILGFLFGLFEGAFTIDPILMPIVFTFIATLLKDIFIWLFAVIFSISFVGINYLGSKMWIEIVYNCILSPFVFTLLSIIKPFNVREKSYINGRN